MERDFKDYGQKKEEYIHYYLNETIRKQLSLLDKFKFYYLNVKFTQEQKKIVILIIIINDF